MMINIRYTTSFNSHAVSHSIDKNTAVIWLKWIKEISLEVFSLSTAYVPNFINTKTFKWVAYKY